FEMDEIIYELKDRIVGLNCGRWDYLFSFIKKLRNDKRFVLPDRDLLTMDKPFLTAFSRELVRVCHHRGIYAIGGVAAQIPSKDDEDVSIGNNLKIKADKSREVLAGHDGAQVAHLAQVPVAQEIFGLKKKDRGRLRNARVAVRPRVEDLLEVPSGSVSEEGIRRDIRVVLRYSESWLRGIGCVSFNDLVEDTATAEIARSLLWQYRKYQALLADGRMMNNSLMKRLINEESVNFDGGCHKLAKEVLRKLVFARNFPEFLTTAAYDHIVVVKDLKEAGKR
ncbi:MAG: malate synthase A, partial [bacterium]|nr:malate synthase A [bacterium]